MSSQQLILEENEGIEHAPTGEEIEDEPDLLADFVAGGHMIAKPFTHVTKTETSRFNLFRRKSGLLNVLARQATKNRICFKNGFLNTFTDTEVTQTNKFLGDIYVSMIELNWLWIIVLFIMARICRALVLDLLDPR